MSRALRNSIYVVVALLCAACDGDMVYYSYRHTPRGWWGKGDTLSFSVPVKDSLRPIAVAAEVRFREAYPYDELVLTATSNLRDSAVFTTDTIRVPLIDSSGNRRGSNWSYLYQASERVALIRPKHPGEYTIKLSQVVDDSIRGISDVGVRIYRIGAVPARGGK